MASVSRETAPVPGLTPQGPERRNWIRGERFYSAGAGGKWWQNVPTGPQWGIVHSLTWAVSSISGFMRAQPAAASGRGLRLTWRGTSGGPCEEEDRAGGPQGAPAPAPAPTSPATASQGRATTCLHTVAGHTMKEPSFSRSPHRAQEGWEAGGQPAGYTPSPRGACAVKVQAQGHPAFRTPSPPQHLPAQAKTPALAACRTHHHPASLWSRESFPGR